MFKSDPEPESINILNKPNLSNVKKAIKNLSPLSETSTTVSIIKTPIPKNVKTVATALKYLKNLN